MSENNDEAVSALEQALSLLVPAGGRVDRDELMFRAGRASAPPPARLWPAAAAAASALAVLFGAVLAVQPEARVVERVPYVEPAPAVPVAESVPGGHEATVRPSHTAPGTGGEPLDVQSYLAARDRVLAAGLDALPRIRAASGDAAALRLGAVPPAGLDNGAGGQG
jgi:hypothetical protein